MPKTAGLPTGTLVMLILRVLRPGALHGYAPYDKATAAYKKIVPLYTTRPADASYIYLRSTSTRAVIRFYLEG